MAKKKPVVVTITKGKHKTQPYTFSIDDVGPGPKVTVRERYTRVSSCKTGALRKLKAQAKITDICGYPSMVPFHEAYLQRALGIFTPDGREIQFVVKPKTTKSK